MRRPYKCVPARRKLFSVVKMSWLRAGEERRGSTCICEVTAASASSEVKQRPRSMACLVSPNVMKRVQGRRSCFRWTAREEKRDAGLGEGCVMLLQTAATIHAPSSLNAPLALPNVAGRGFRWGGQPRRPSRLSSSHPTSSSPSNPAAP